MVDFSSGAVAWASVWRQRMLPGGRRVAVALTVVGAGRRWSSPLRYAILLVALTFLLVLPGMRTTVAAQMETVGHQENNGASVPANQDADSQAVLENGGGESADEDATPKTVTVAGNVIDAQGNGLPEARVHFFLQTYDAASRDYVDDDVCQTTTDQQGKFALPVPVEKLPADGNRVVQLIVQDAERGFGWLDLEQLAKSLKANTARPPVKEWPATIRVQPTRDLAIRLVAPSGQPLAAAKIVVNRFVDKSFGEYRELQRRGLYMPASTLPKSMRPTVRGDGQGKYVLPKVPRAWSVVAKVRSSDSAPDVSVALGCDKATTIHWDDSGELRGIVDCDDTKFDRSRIELFVRLKEPVMPSDASDYLLSFWTRVSFSENGEFKLAHLIPGVYSIRPSIKEGDDYYALPTANQEVAPQAAGKPVKIVVRKGVKLRGRVVDAETGEGVPTVAVSFKWTNPVADEGRQIEVFGRAETNAQGYYEGFGRHGRMSIYLGLLDQLPKTHLPPLKDLYDLQPIQIEDGQEFAEFGDIKLIRAAELSGLVVNEKGEPQADAEVHPHFAPGMNLSKRDVFRTDAQGRFRVERADPDDTLPLRAAVGDAVTNGPVVVDAAEKPKLVKLVVSSEFSFYLEGQVVGRDGKPVLGTEVRLQWHRNVVSRKSGMSGTGSNYQTLTVDLSGRFRTRALWPGDRYRVQVVAHGYRGYESPEVKGVAGQTHDYGKIVLTSTSGVVSGRVVNSAGQPVSGAEVFNRGDGPAEVSATSDADGRFTLTGVVEGNVFVFARKQSLRLAGTVVTSPAMNVELTLHSAGDSRDATPQATLAPLTYEERRQLAESFLRQLYKLPLQQRQEINFLILRYMARANPPVALEWVSQPENGKRRNDVLMTVAETIIEHDPEEALSLVGQVRSSSYFYRVLGMAEQVRAKSPDVAKKLAEDLVIRARQGDPPDSIYEIAQTGRLLASLGEREAGKLMMDEAFAAASRLGDKSREAFVRGFTAEQIAPFNLEGALQLVAGINETSGTSQPRHLGNIAVAIAPGQPEKAVEMAKRLDGRVAMRVAYHLAKTDYDRALALVANLQGRGADRYRAQALAWMAMARHATDPRQANDLIDRSFAVLLSGSSDFDSWSNYGSEAVPAAAVVWLAREIHYPDLSSAVMRAVAARRNVTPRDSEVSLLQAQAKMAKFLALADRKTAKALLMQLADRQDLLGGGGYDTISWEDWLMAWCLTDSQQAREVFQKALDWELNRGKGKLGQQAVIRVIGRLVLPDEQLHAELANEESLWYPGNE